MAITIASSKRRTSEEAVRELTHIFGTSNLTTVIYFASTKYAPEEISKGMQSAFPRATVFGCSSAGEIVSGKMSKNSIVAMAFDAETIPDIKVEIVENISTKIDVHDTFVSFEKHFGETALDMKPARYLGIVLVDGLCGREERLMDAIGDKTNILFVGGSAADDFKFKSTHVFANGNYYTDSAVIALLKLVAPFELIKSQSVRAIGPELLVTKANEDKREILEFNHEPAAIAYAEALGVSVNELAEYFPRYPLGLIIDGEPYIRGPKYISGDSVFFYCSSVEGMPLALLESTNIIDDTKVALESAKAKLGCFSGIIVFNCAHRALELGFNNLAVKYGELFQNIPTIGFNSYGEQFIGHVNQTAVMIVFK